MNSFEERMMQEKQRYINFCSNNKDKKIYIFGAGRMGKPLFLFCRENNIDIEAFCVSDKDVNKLEEYGKAIVELSEIEYEKSKVAILLGVNSRLNDEVCELLQEKGFTNYIKSTEYLRYFGNYQLEFYQNPMMEITTKMGCAVNCKFCPQDVLLRAYFKTGNEIKYMSLEMFKNCLDKMPKNVLIEFAGFTEPFFNKDCADMILYARDRGHKVNLFTTLRGMTRNDFEKIKDVYFEEFVLHVPDEEKYANIPITEEYLELLKLVVGAKKSNGDSFVDYACAQGNVPQMIKEYLGDNIRIFISLLDRAGNLDDESLYGKRNIRGKIKCETSCRIDHNVLLPDGRVVLCAQDYGMQHVMGNLLEQDYSDVVYGEKYQHIIACMNDENGTCLLCRNCSLAYTEGEKNV